MADVALCRLSTERLALRREDPALTRALRADPPLVVARAAAAMRKSPKPAPARSIESVAAAVRALLAASSAAGEHVLVFGPERASK